MRHQGPPPTLRPLQRHPQSTCLAPLIRTLFAGMASERQVLMREAVGGGRGRRARVSSLPLVSGSDGGHLAALCAPCTQSFHSHHGGGAAGPPHQVGWESSEVMCGTKAAGGGGAPDKSDWEDRAARSRPSLLLESRALRCGQTKTFPDLQEEPTNEGAAKLSVVSFPKTRASLTF